MIRHLRRLAARARVVLKAAPTYLVAASGMVTLAAPELARLLPEQAETIGLVAARVAAWLAAAVLIIRRVTPVVDRAARGILPQER